MANSNKQDFEKTGIGWKRTRNSEIWHHISI